MAWYMRGVARDRTIHKVEDGGRILERYYPETLTVGSDGIRCMLTRRPSGTDSSRPDESEPSEWVLIASNETRRSEPGDGVEAAWDPACRGSNA